jgi:prepilin-type N-terminal cleavage/methylation domain-containing protein
MSILSRRGFTLPELMIALVLLAVFSAGVYQILLNSQRTFSAQTGRIDLQQNLRAGVTILPGEFRELDAGDSDITSMSATAITIRAMRQLAFICTAPTLGGGGNVTFAIRQSPFFGDRKYFQNGDSILVFWEGNPSTRSDDGWVRGAVVTEVNMACADGTAGYQVVWAPLWNASVTNTATAITAGSPVRGYTSLTYELWQSPSDNNYYLAQQVGAATPQPLVGPLSGASGLTFTYYDSTGTTVTALTTQVASIGITVRGRTTNMIRQADDPSLAYKYDSLSVRVALRNNPRCGTGSMPTRSC